MKFAWIEEIIIVDGDEILDVGGASFDPPQYEQVEQGTGNGAVVGINRGASVGEREGVCTNQELIWGMTTEFYSVVDNVFTPITQAEKDVIENNNDKKNSYDKFIDGINDKINDENLKPFVYTKDSIIYNFVSDKNVIQGTKNDVIGDVDKTLPIRTFRNTVNEGKWKCSNSNGDVVYVPFTIEEFILFAGEYYLRWSDNFTNYENHINNVDVIYNDPTKTADDISDYDYSIGWV